MSPNRASFLSPLYAAKRQNGKRLCVVCRYLLHVFMEAGCLEWCVVIGLILRDASVIKQAIGFLDSPEVPQETVQSVRSGLLAVDAWASADW